MSDIQSASYLRVVGATFPVGSPAGMWDSQIPTSSAECDDPHTCSYCQQALLQF